MIQLIFPLGIKTRCFINKRIFIKYNENSTENKIENELKNFNKSHNISLNHTKDKNKKLKIKNTRKKQ